MAAPQELVETVEPPAPLAEAVPPSRHYDRSSLDGDYMVMIAGQTAEDFERDAPEKRICEYIDGIIYMPSPASDRHQDLVIFLVDLLNGFRLARGGCHVLTGPAVLRLDPEKKLEPDIFVRPPRAAPAPQPAALLVAEVFSHSTQRHDLLTKLPIFRAFNIPEIWLIDDFHRRVIVEWRGDAAGPYHHAEPTAGPLRSVALPGFWIDVAWLWEADLPNPRRCLEQILAAPPA